MRASRSRLQLQRTKRSQFELRRTRPPIWGTAATTDRSQARLRARTTTWTGIQGPPETYRIRTTTETLQNHLHQGELLMRLEHELFNRFVGYFRHQLHQPQLHPKFQFNHKTRRRLWFMFWLRNQKNNRKSIFPHQRPHNQASQKFISSDTKLRYCYKFIFKYKWTSIAV